MFRKAFLSFPMSIDLGLLAARLAFGLIMAINYGLGKLTAGPDRWRGLGSTFGDVLPGSISVPEFLFVPLGFMAMFAEFFGALFLAAGLGTRIAGFMLFFTMVIAALSKVGKVDAEGDPVSMALPVAYMMAYLFITIAGPGRLSLDYLIFGKKQLNPYE